MCTQTMCTVLHTNNVYSAHKHTPGHTRTPITCQKDGNNFTGILLGKKYTKNVLTKKNSWTVYLYLEKKNIKSYTLVFLDVC